MKHGKELRDFLRSAGKRVHNAVEAVAAEHVSYAVQEQPESYNSAQRPGVHESSGQRLQRLRPDTRAVIPRQERDMLPGAHVEYHPAGKRAYFHALPTQKPQDGRAAYLHFRDR